MVAIRDVHNIKPKQFASWKLLETFFFLLLKIWLITHQDIQNLVLPQFHYIYNWKLCQLTDPHTAWAY